MVSNRIKFAGTLSHPALSLLCSAVIALSGLGILEHVHATLHPDLLTLDPVHACRTTWHEQTSAEKDGLPHNTSHSDKPDRPKDSKDNCGICALIKNVHSFVPQPSILFLSIGSTIGHIPCGTFLGHSHEGVPAISERGPPYLA